jgi:hypothetical protein
MDRVIRIKFGAYCGLYLVGDKAANRVAAVQVLNPDGKSISMPLIEYLRSRIRPNYTTLPWRVDVEFEEQNKSGAS